MRILYIAAGIPAPGAVGGSTHVMEVTTGLARRGHIIVTIAGPARAPLPRDWPATAQLINMPLPKALALGTAPVVWTAARRLRPEVVMERYYNFAGAGLGWAARHGVPALLEVNAPLWDPPGSPKDRLDRLLPGGPLRRWARWQARVAARVVAPLPEAVTCLTPHPAIEPLTWGANIDRFDPARIGDTERAALRADLGIAAGATVIAFAGSFRRWHGVETLLSATRPLLDEGRAIHLLLIGSGERWEWARTLATTPPLSGHVTLTGQVPYGDVPRLLRAADVAAAPFDVAAHAPLRAIGFYWSPLKVFEAMAMALPVVVPAIADLTAIVRDGLEGLAFASGDTADLSRALAWLDDHPAERQAMGRRARERAVARYSWSAHCGELERILLEMRDVARPTARAVAQR
ncbi:MAG: glycosyltransferase family 4 protein [Chloroflexi bacterium]|nr:glycosyltransferase family 4 protein [Chloroflexota bacterium]